MISQKVKIDIKLGLHARPAGTLTKLAQKYQSEVAMKAKDKIVNVKSIMGLLSAGVSCGTEVEFICTGPDEAGALRDIIAAVKDGLGES